MGHPANQHRLWANAASSAFAFVFILGIVNLFADMTYEGGASINGPFMGMLGASAAAISIVAGLGEFLGYGVRLLAGFVADKTGKYWMFTFIGYAINLLAVPAMVFAGSWQMAAIFVCLERVGRGIRKPTVEAMLSYTTGKLGRGWVYAMNTALDETGAMLGPLVIATMLFFKADYRTGYAALLITSLLAMIALTVARVVFPMPSRLERGRTAQAKGFTKSFWLFMLAGSLFAAGLMSFELISFHLVSKGIVTGYWIPVFLALSTAGGIVASLVFGKLYDRIGNPVVLVAVLFSALFGPLVFFGNFITILMGMFLWGVGYATQDTLLKAIIASLLPEGKRNTAFGLFYMGYGGGWLLGSIVTGLLYSYSIPLLVGFAMCIQIASIPIFYIAHKVRV